MTGFINLFYGLFMQKGTMPNTYQQGAVFDELDSTSTQINQKICHWNPVGVGSENPYAERVRKSRGKKNNIYKVPKPEVQISDGAYFNCYNFLWKKKQNIYIHIYSWRLLECEVLFQNRTASTVCLEIAEVPHLNCLPYSEKIYLLQCL